MGLPSQISFCNLSKLNSILIHDSSLGNVSILTRSVTSEIKVRNFDELYELIEKLVGNINGTGELYIYDTSLRIGAKLGIEPNKIYLHRGTREGQGI